MNLASAFAPEKSPQRFAARAQLLDFGGKGSVLIAILDKGLQAPDLRLGFQDSPMRVIQIFEMGHERQPGQAVGILGLDGPACCMPMSYGQPTRTVIPLCRLWC